MTALISNTDAGLESFNPLLESQSPSQIVRWAAAEFDEDLVMSSSFGADSAVLLHLAASIVPRIKVIFIDTGYLFPETHQFMEQLRRRLNLNIWTYRTKNDPFDYLNRAAENDPATRRDVTACCAQNKNEPFERAMRDLAPRAWLRGIRRTQAETRKQVDPIEWSRRYNCYAISPLLSWTPAEIDTYVQVHQLPRHPLVETGYLSIGCNPLTCTRPVEMGADPRSGRWANQEKRECGINLVDSLDSAKL